MREAWATVLAGVRSLVGWPMAAVLVFLLVNIGFNLLFLVTTGDVERAWLDARRLAAAEPWERLDAEAAFAAVYGQPDGTAAAADRLSADFARRLRQGAPLVFDQATAAVVIERYGQVDARVLPVGVYVGLRTIGPDTGGLSELTRYPAQYALLARHAFILIVPPPSEEGWPMATSFAAGLTKDFVPGSNDSTTMYATVHPYDVGGFDFPNPGQAVHELFPLSVDVARVRAAPARLETAAAAIRAAQMPYGLFTRNSNTVIGCLLRASGALDGREEAFLDDWRLGIRAWGLDFDLPLRDALPEPAAFPDLARDCHD